MVTSRTSQKAYDEAKKAVESAEAGLALLDGTSSGTKRIAKRRRW